MHKVLEAELMDPDNFKSASAVDGIVPDKPGLYCIRVKDTGSLPSPFDAIIAGRKHNIVYIGIASKSLKKRFFNQELRAAGHGTFFRSIGAVLGYMPVKGSLTDKANKRNYKFSESDELEIVKWINTNLTVNWIECDDNIEELENGLIEKYLPLLNLKWNPAALRELKDLRAECVVVANEQ